MTKTLGGAEFDPDDGFTAENIFRRAFGEHERYDAFTRRLRVITSAPFAGAPSLARYPVELIGPYPN